MPSLREMMLQKQREEEAARRESEPVAPMTTLAFIPPEHRLAPPSKIQERPTPVEPVVEIPIDALRGLYWLATPDHVGDKKATRGQMKRKVNDALLTKEGMRTLLQSLEKFVFS